MTVSGIILTGGKNKRMGRNKSLEKVAGKTLLERVCERLVSLCNEVIIVTSAEFSHVPMQGDHTVVLDIYPEKGPLGGIYTGLYTSHGDLNIVVGSDMPFLNTRLLTYMTEVASGYDAVVPEPEEGMKEPLHSVYTKRCADIVGERLRNDLLSVHSFIDMLNVRYLTKEEILTCDPDMASFFDINYPSDLDRAEMLAEKYDNPA